MMVAFRAWEEGSDGRPNRFATWGPWAERNRCARRRSYGAGDSRACGRPCRHSCVLEENNGLRPRDCCPADWVSTARDLFAIARRRAVAFRESRDYGEKRRENRGLGCLSELPFDFYESRR